eukprot:maker-scaffold93_size381549-snap-gene-0.13 protein:Tk04390 transcript:maker-scaffold93_size381549-snap-gene-0.13-mRNA-1 annotation:"monoglyceride lipase"
MSGEVRFADLDPHFGADEPEIDSGSNGSSPPRQTSNDVAEVAEDGVRIEKRYLDTLDGHNVFCRHWKPPHLQTVKALVFICHGFAEHLEWYTELAMLLAENDYLVFGHDHIGHGMSGGSRGYIPCMDTLIYHVVFHVTKTKMDFKGLPVFLYGHSMGGNVALRTVLQNPNIFKGMILEGPLIKISDDLVTLPKLMLAKLVQLVLPELQTEKLPIEEVTTDLDSQHAMSNDPLRYDGGMKVGTLLAMLESLKIVDDHLSEVHVPFLTMHGLHDSLCLAYGSEELHLKARSRDKQIIIFPDAKHHLLLEQENIRRQALTETLNWLEQRSQ